MERRRAKTSIVCDTLASEPGSVIRSRASRPMFRAEKPAQTLQKTAARKPALPASRHADCSARGRSTAVLAVLSAPFRASQEGIESHESRVAGSAVRVEAAGLVGHWVTLHLGTLRLVRRHRVGVRRVCAPLDCTRAPRHICARRHGDHTSRSHRRQVDVGRLGRFELGRACPGASSRLLRATDRPRPGIGGGACAAHAQVGAAERARGSPIRRLPQDPLSPGAQSVARRAG